VVGLEEVALVVAIVDVLLVVMLDVVGAVLEDSKLLVEPAVLLVLVADDVDEELVVVESIKVNVEIILEDVGTVEELVLEPVGLELGQPPVTEGTALTPEPMAMRPVPQSSLLAM
jgi:hypothetical protein